MTLFFGLAAVLCLAYYIILLQGAVSYAFIWLAAGSVFLCVFIYRRWIQAHMPYRTPVWFQVFLRTTAALFALIFLLVEGLIVANMLIPTRQGLDYIIVLGDTLEGNDIGQELRYRLDTAVAYMQKNPQTIAVVSGGKGEGETVTRAEIMAGYMTERGIPAERIVREVSSRNTRQNISYSTAYILLNTQSQETPTIGIVSSNYHIYEALLVARKLRIDNISGVASPVSPVLFPHKMVLEFGVLIQERFLGNI